MLGDLIGEFQGKITGMRLLPDEKRETSEEASGRILGIEATWLATSVSKQMPNGVVMSEGEAVITTVGGKRYRSRKVASAGQPEGDGRLAEEAFLP